MERRSLAWGLVLLGAVASGLLTSCVPAMIGAASSGAIRRSATTEQSAAQIAVIEANARATGYEFSEEQARLFVEIFAATIGGDVSDCWRQAEDLAYCVELPVRKNVTGEELLTDLAKHYPDKEIGGAVPLFRHWANAGDYRFRHYVIDGMQVVTLIRDPENGLDRFQFVFSRP